MKKFYTIPILTFSLLFAAACGDEEVDQPEEETVGNGEVDETEDDEGEEDDTEGLDEATEEDDDDADGLDDAFEEDEDEDDATADADGDEDSEPGADEQEMLDIIEQMQEAESEINSLSVEMNMNQHLYDDEDGFEVNSYMYMDAIMDPVSFYMEQEMEEDFGDESFTIETYIKEDEFYLLDPEMGEWYLFPEDMANEFITAQEDMLEHMESDHEFLLDYIEEFTLEEDDDHYIITLVSDEQEHMDQLDEFDFGMLEEDPEFNQMMQAMEIENLEYELYIDKETYYTSEIRNVMEGTIEVEGDDITLEQETEILQFNIDEIDEIEIPEDVQEEAEELDIPEG